MGVSFTQNCTLPKAAYHFRKDFTLNVVSEYACKLISKQYLLGQLYSSEFLLGKSLQVLSLELPRSDATLVPSKC